MFRIFFQVIAPLCSLLILILGNGLFTTLQAVRLEMDGASNWVIGGISGAYYGGLVLGSIITGRFISRVGHIRAYATFASATAIVCLLPGLLQDPSVWIALRFISGYCIAGLFIVIESWLLASSTFENRGKVLALYMTTFYAAQGAGQFLLNLSDPQSIIPFCIVAILTSLSVVPVCMTYRPSPPIEESSSLGMRKLYKISPTGVLGCFSAGLILGAIYGLLPSFVSQLDFSIRDIALTMGLTIFGGMLLQYPVGYFSDLFDRRKGIIFISIAICILSFSLILSAYASKEIFFILTFVFGGFAFTLYPISICHACDYVKSSDIVAASSGLLLAYGFGATSGPLIAPAFINLIGPAGLFIFFILIAGLLITFVIWRMTIREAIPAEEQQSFVVVPHTLPITNELDPRIEGESDAESSPDHPENEVTATNYTHPT